MSLDLDSKKGRAHNTSPIDGTAGGGGFAAVDALTFDSGDMASAGNFLLQVKLGGNVDITAGGPDALSTVWPDPFTGAPNLLEDGMRLTIVKQNSGPGTLQFKDPITGVFYSYLDRAGESLSLIYDTSTGAGQWVAEI